jgi:FG-GAP-like repeat
LSPEEQDLQAFPRVYSSQLNRALLKVIHWSHTMRPLRFACLFIVFISTMVLAQSNDVTPVDQPLSRRSLSRISSGLPFTKRHRHGYGASAPLSQSSQTSGLNFAPPLTTGTGGISEWEAVADVNGDGKPDLVVTSFCYDCSVPSEIVFVQLGNGDGTFPRGASYSTGGFSSNGAAAVADVNGDGKPDIVVLNQCADSTCTSSNVGVLLGNGDGTFQTAVTYGSGGISTFSVAVADVTETASQT